MRVTSLVLAGLAILLGSAGAHGEELDLDIEQLLAPVGVECEPDPGPCIAGQHTICLHDNRFMAKVEFTPPGGEPQPATSFSWSDRASLVFFFDFRNLEMVVKVLDACVEPFNRYWVFFTASTNVEFTVKVTDLAANVARCYHNPQGMAALPVQDTGAFDTCDVE